MKIEDHWNDVEIYYVEFIVKQKNHNRIIRKTIVVDCENDYNIQEIIGNKFNNVIEINCIDSMGDGLCLKTGE
ncbi:MAG: hypothetical protein RR936_04055 [Carnobacterium sp.]|uniref:hypothetical protein n=1 Tax=Carnobacterium sp. TaxID=48221 RepID=UPI002FC836C3